MGFPQVSSPEYVSEETRRTILDHLPNNDDHKYHNEHDGADDNDKVQDLSLQWSQTRLWRVRELGDLAENS